MVSTIPRDAENHMNLWYSSISWQEILEADETDTICVPPCLSVLKYWKREDIEESPGMKRFILGQMGEAEFLKNFTELKMGGILVCGLESKDLVTSNVVRKKSTVQSEWDAIFFHRNRGIFVIEIKAIETNDAYTVADRFKKAKVQLDKNIENVKKCFLHIYGKDCPWMITGFICFPFIYEDRKIYEGYKVIDKSAINDHTALKKFFNQLQSASKIEPSIFQQFAAEFVCCRSKVEFHSQAYNAMQVATWIMEQDIQQKQDPTKIQSMAGNGPSGKIILSEKQLEIVECKRKRVIISGAPGSGKTLILMLRALRAAMENKEGSVFVFVNEKLKDKYEHYFFEERDKLVVDRANNIDRRPKIHVHTVDMMRHAKPEDDVFFDETPVQEPYIEMIESRAVCEGSTTVVFTGLYNPAEASASLRLYDSRLKGYEQFELTKVFRGTGRIFDIWKYYYPRDITLGHSIDGVPVKKLECENLKKAEEGIAKDLTTLKKTNKVNTNLSKLSNKHVAVITSDEEDEAEIREYLNGRGIPCGSVDEQTRKLGEESIVAVDVYLSTPSYEWPVVYVILKPTVREKEIMQITASRCIARLTIIKYKNFSQSANAEVQEDSSTENSHDSMHILEKGSIQSHRVALKRITEGRPRSFPDITYEIPLETFTFTEEDDILREFEDETLNMQCLASCLPYLCENLDVEEMVSHLQKKQIISQREADSILKGKTTSKKTRQLVTLIKQRGPEEFSCFMDCLLETNQRHIFDKLVEERRNLAQRKNIRSSATTRSSTSKKFFYKYKCILATVIAVGILGLAGICYYSYFYVLIYQGECSSHVSLFSIQKSLQKSYQERFRSVVPLSMPFTFDTENNWVELTLKVDDTSISTTKELADLFKNDFEKVKMVIIEGDPATGKTSLLQRIALEWAQKESQWSDYDLVIHAEFRKVRQKNFTRITGLLIDYLRGYLVEEDCKQLGQFINDNKCNNEYEILVLLDGYDESSLKDQCQELTEYLYEVTVGKPLLFKVVLTSRRGYLSELRGQEGRLIFADLLGFTNIIQKEDYIKKHFTAENGTQLTEQIKYVHNLLESNKNVKRLSDTPLLLTFICLVHHKLKNGSELELYMNTIWWLLDRYQRNNPDQDVPRLFDFQNETNEEKFHILENNYQHFPQLHKLGRMAMEDIFKSTFTETHLEIFNVSVIIQQVGLLKKEIARDDSFHIKTEYSFPHRTIQEFLTAFAFFYSVAEPPEHFMHYFLYPWDRVGYGTVQNELKLFMRMISNNSKNISDSRKKMFRKITECPITMDQTGKNVTAEAYQGKMNLRWNEIESIPKSSEDAIIFLKRKAEDGNAEAQYSLGIIYYFGRIVEKDLQEAVEWWRKVAEQGYAAAQYNLGIIHENGQGVSQSYDEAAKWFKKAAEQDYADAQYKLGVIYEKGRGVDQSYEEADIWYTKAAKQGHAKAQINLELSFEWRQEVDQSCEGARKWWRKAAEQIYDDAELNLRNQCKMRQKTDQFYEEALKRWRKAAEQGYAHAQYKLGVMHAYGQGVEQSYEEAVKWYTKAAEQGHAKAQFNLALSYHQGQGVDHSFIEAVKWYTKAAELGLTEAQEILSNLSEGNDDSVA